MKELGFLLVTRVIRIIVKLVWSAIGMVVASMEAHAPGFAAFCSLQTPFPPCHLSSSCLSIVHLLPFDILNNPSLMCTCSWGGVKI